MAKPKQYIMRDADEELSKSGIYLNRVKMRLEAYVVGEEGAACIGYCPLWKSEEDIEFWRANVFRSFMKMPRKRRDGSDPALT